MKTISLGPLAASQCDGHVIEAMRLEKSSLDLRHSDRKYIGFDPAIYPFYPRSRQISFFTKPFPSLGLRARSARALRWELTVEMIRAGELVHIIVSDDGSDGKSVFFIRQAQDLRRWHRVDHAAAREIRIRSENFQ